MFSIIFYIGIVLIILKIIQLMVVANTESGKIWLKSRDTMDYEIKNILDNYIEDTTIDEEAIRVLDDDVTIDFTTNELIIPPNPSSPDVSSHKEEKGDEYDLYCKFSKDEPFELLEISDSFLFLIDIRDIDTLKHAYKYVKTMNSTSSKMDIDSAIAHLKEENHQIHIYLKDLFRLDQMVYDKIAVKINHHLYNEDSLASGIVTMKTNTSTLDTIFKYNFSIKDDQLLMKLKLHQMKLRPYTIMDSGNDFLYQEVVNNFILDMPIAIMVINNEGIKFLNKTMCDWFAIPYSKIENIQKGLDISVTPETIFDPIDQDLSNQIDGILKDPSSSKGFYRTYIPKDTISLINDDINMLDSLPSEIFIQVIPFKNMNNKTEILITIEPATLLYSFMKKRNILSDKETKISDHIHSLNKYNQYFKNFFNNTKKICFGKVDTQTGEIIICNELFENLVKYDKHKKRYQSIIECIVKDYDTQKSDTNYWTFDIVCEDRIIQVLYSYSDKYADILIQDNVVESSCGSNCSMEILRAAYNISNLPILCITKDGKIVFTNEIFRKLFVLKQNLENETSSNVLDLVEKADHRRIKRAITETMKEESYNIKDPITIHIENIRCKCRVMMVKYNSNGEDHVVITLFDLVTEPILTPSKHKITTTKTKQATTIPSTPTKEDVLLDI